LLISSSGCPWALSMALLLRCSWPHHRRRRYSWPASGQRQPPLCHRVSALRSSGAADGTGRCWQGCSPGVGQLSRGLCTRWLRKACKIPGRARRRQSAIEGHARCGTRCLPRPGCRVHAVLGQRFGLTFSQSFRPACAGHQDRLRETVCIFEQDRLRETLCSSEGDDDGDEAPLLVRTIKPLDYLFENEYGGYDECWELIEGAESMDCEVADWVDRIHGVDDCFDSLAQVDEVLAWDDYYQNIFMTFDSHNDGQINEDEFIPFFSKDVQDIEIALDQFREFDEDGSGFMNEE